MFENSTTMMFILYLGVFTQIRTEILKSIFIIHIINSNLAANSAKISTDDVASTAAELPPPLNKECMNPGLPIGKT